MLGKMNGRMSSWAVTNRFKGRSASLPRAAQKEIERCWTAIKPFVTQRSDGGLQEKEGIYGRNSPLRWLETALIHGLLFFYINYY